MAISTICPWLVSENPDTVTWLVSCLEQAAVTDVWGQASTVESLEQLAIEPDPRAVLYLDLRSSNGQVDSQLQEARQKAGRIPLIAIVANSQDGTRALEAGADDYLIPAETGATLLARATRYAQERRRLRTQEAPDRFRLYLENAPDVIFVLDLQERCVTYLNRAELFGYNKEALAQPGAILDLIHSSDHPAVLQHWRQLSGAAEGDVFVFEYRLRRQDGEWEWVQSRETVLSTGGARAPQILVSLSVI
ncbi:MAG TPA: PAS domain-containing protein, partial [Candidatus Binatia bacterium]|nr:PAS domain-containing protein [Candidatus Binatia bacterium]